MFGHDFSKSLIKPFAAQRAAILLVAMSRQKNASSAVANVEISEPLYHALGVEHSDLLLLKKTTSVASTEQASAKQFKSSPGQIIKSGS
jgi:hypothetical protein